LAVNNLLAISNQWKSWSTAANLCFNKSFKINCIISARAMSMERSPFSAKNQTLQDLTEHIFRLRCRYHQLLFK